MNSGNIVLASKINAKSFVLFVDHPVFLGICLELYNLMNSHISVFRLTMIPLTFSAIPLLSTPSKSDQWTWKEKAGSKLSFIVEHVRVASSAVLATFWIRNTDSSRTWTDSEYGISRTNFKPGLGQLLNHKARCHSEARRRLWMDYALLSVCLQKYSRLVKKK